MKRKKEPRQKPRLKNHNIWYSGFRIAPKYWFWQVCNEFLASLQNGHDSLQASIAFIAMAHSKRLRSISQPTKWGFAISPLTSRLEAEQPPEQ